MIGGLIIILFFLSFWSRETNKRKRRWIIFLDPHFLSITLFSSFFFLPKSSADKVASILLILYFKK